MQGREKKKKTENENENENEIKSPYSDGVAVNEKNETELCSRGFAVLGHFCAKIITLRL